MLREYFFLRKENKITQFNQQLFSPSYVFRHFGEYQERIWRNKRCLHSGGKRAHERNLCIKRCLRLGGSMHMRCDTI